MEDRKRKMLVVEKDKGAIEIRDYVDDGENRRYKAERAESIEEPVETWEPWAYTVGQNQVILRHRTHASSQGTVGQNQVILRHQTYASRQGTVHCGIQPGCFETSNIRISSRFSTLWDKTSF